MRVSPKRSLVFFDDRYHEVYGAQENLLLLGSLCAAEGHRCRFMTSAEGELVQAALARGLACEVVPAPPQLRTFERGTIRGGVGNRWRSLRAWSSYVRRVDRALEADRPDVVVAGSVRSVMHLTRSALRRRGPAIVLYAQNSTPFGFFAALAALVSDRILLIAPGAARTFPPGVLRVLASRVRLLPSGRDVDRYSVDRPHHGGSADRPVAIVTVGSVTRRKGLHVLVEALAAVGRPCTLSVVGGTSGSASERYRDEIQAQADRLGVELILLGWRDDVVPFLERADLFALASFDEGLPGVLLEAMAAGLPCVTTNAGGSGDLVREAGCGLSVAIDDADALAAALRLLIDDPAGRDRMGAAGRHHVEQEYSLTAYRRRFDAILTELLDA
ncbi:MAG: glycosyltransferase family 4 protein [Acidimicrobiia bacterium]|nr:glycosyltransferase family 4 protein [Acidimicrobiia bacterium]